MQLLVKQYKGLKNWYSCTNGEDTANPATWHAPLVPLPITDDENVRSSQGTADDVHAHVACAAVYMSRGQTILPQAAELLPRSVTVISMHVGITA
jgi:hypothetical protein